MNPGLFLTPRGKDVNDSVNGLRGVIGVEGRKDEVAGFGHRQGDLNRVDVAHLADEEDIGVLAEGGSQSSVERRAVQADFALVDSGRFCGCERIRPGLQSSECDTRGSH